MNPPIDDAPVSAQPSEKVVLIVDDDDNVRDFIELSIAPEGFQLVLAANGHDATRKCEARTPDLIITDLMMPGQGGYEFLRDLQAAGNGRIPVIVVTGSVLNSSTVEMIRQEANVVEFMEKPIRMVAFIQALHEHLKTVPARISPRAVQRSRLA